jgi:predicted nucleic acid-binding protein
MPVLVDTCGWIEWLCDTALASEFEAALLDTDQLVVPTSVQFELYKWVRRERGEATALEIVALTEQARVFPLSSAIALLAGDLAIEHRLSFADAIILATARQTDALLLTCDDHFEGLADVQFIRKRGIQEP